jgi:hypothetical protein
MIIKNQQSAQLMQCMASQDEFGLIVFKNLDLKKQLDHTKKLENVGEINTITAICYLLNRFNSNLMLENH